MRTIKNDITSDELSKILANIIKEERIKHHYSLEDLSNALMNKKNRQTLHKYENGLLNIPYDIFFDICDIFNIDNAFLENITVDKVEKEKLEKKLIKDYINNQRKDKNLTTEKEKIINTYKNASYEPTTNKSDLSIKIIDDSMMPTYEKGDKIYFKKEDNYKNGDDIVIAIKNNILAVRRLYKYPKGIILQALNPKYPTININIVSNDMIIGKVTSIYREVK